MKKKIVGILVMMLLIAVPCLSATRTINEIENILKIAVTADSTSSDGIKVGDKVNLEIDGTEIVYTIVGSHEAKPEEKLISCDSPMGEALLGHKEGDQVEIQAPKGIIIYKIKKVN